MKIITKMVNIEGGLWWRAEYPCGSRGYGKTIEEAVRNLTTEFPDDGAKTEVFDGPHQWQQESRKSAEQYDAFIKTLEAPSAPNKKLKSLLASKSPWEKDKP